MEDWFRIKRIYLLTYLIDMSNALDSVTVGQ